MKKNYAERCLCPLLQHQVLFLAVSLFASSINAQSVTLVTDTVLPVTGSGFGMSCTLSVPFTSNGITFMKNGNLSFTCTGSSHICLPNSEYILKANQTGVFMTISSLDRGRHEGIWTCTWSQAINSITSNPINLTVYTMPSGIRFTQEPSVNADLSMTSATFQCSTVGCSYPDPVIRWMYEDQDIATANQTSTSDGCTSKEKIYSSTLFLQRNSTLSDNSDKSVIFSCRTDYPGTSINIRATATKSVRFAVTVTEAFLQKNNENITDILTVNLWEPVALTCTTGYGRPDPIIDWYIGSEKRGSGRGLSFTPSNADHNQTVYCQAYNTDPNRKVFSLKPRLSVQVRVTEAVLQQSSQNVTDILTVISGILVTLTCMTGLSRPDPTIDWYIGSQKRGSGPGLNFTPSNADHNQTIYCQAYNTDPNIIVYSLKPRLSVQVYVTNVNLDSSGATVSFVDGTEKSLTCTTNPSRPQPVIRWWLDGNEVTDLSSTKVNENSTLFIASSKLLLTLNRTHQNKKVYCDAKVNGQVNAIESTRPIIDVLYAPDIKVNISGSTVVGYTAVLMCTPQGNPPQYTFHQWIHRVGQKEIRRFDGVNTFNLSSLSLSNISIQDMGTYICTVDNSITGLDGKINQIGDTYLYVTGLPVIGDTRSTFTGETNKPASIEIPFYSFSSINEVKFMKQLNLFEIYNTSNISIYISPSNINMMFYNNKVTISGHVAVLYFRNLINTDFGNYTLQLTNIQGNISMEFDFIASGPPSMPKKFFLIRIEDGLLVFGIEKGLNGGHEQTFIIEYKPSAVIEAAWSTILKINETDLGDPFSDGTYNIKIPKIQDGHYVFRVYAENKKGNSSRTDSVNVEISTEISGRNSPVAAVVGGVIGAVVLVISIVIVFVVVKRRTLKPKMEGLKNNPVYDSSESGPVVQEYAAVVKPKKLLGHTEDPSKLYAQVDKTLIKKGKIASEGKPRKTTKAALKGKQLKMSKGDVYENTPLPSKSSAENVYENPGHLAANPNSSENVYENPESSVSQGQLANKESLLYADVILGPPTAKAGKPIIHGLDNRTEYAEIAYGKRGEPLLEIDEKKESGGAEKNNGTTN